MGFPRSGNCDPTDELSLPTEGTCGGSRNSMSSGISKTTPAKLDNGMDHPHKFDYTGCWYKLFSFLQGRPTKTKMVALTASTTTAPSTKRKALYLVDVPSRSGIDKRSVLRNYRISSTNDQCGVDDNATISQLSTFVPCIWDWNPCSLICHCQISHATTGRLCL